MGGNSESRLIRPLPWWGISGWLIILVLSGTFVTSAFCQQPARLPAHKDSEFTKLFRRTNGWVAGDGAISIYLSDKRVLWLFGDSYIDQFDPATQMVPCLFNARNAAVVQNSVGSEQWQALRGPQAGEHSFFRPPETPPGEPWPCFWPGAGFQNGKTIYIYLAEMLATGAGGPFGFTNIGQYFAKLSFPELKVLDYVPLPARNGISFWCGYVNDEVGGITYAFGDKQTNIASNVYVARFPTKNPEGAWSFWDGIHWSAKATDAAVIARGASFSVGVSRINNRYVLVTSDFSVACDQGKNIYIATANRPTGPFSPFKRIFTVDDIVQGHYPFFYSVFAHPEHINGNNELLITYSINGYEPCLPSCVNGQMQPDYYRPRAIGLPLAFLQKEN